MAVYGPVRHQKNSLWTEAISLYNLSLVTKKQTNKQTKNKNKKQKIQQKSKQNTNNTKTQKQKQKIHTHTQNNKNKTKTKNKKVRQNKKNIICIYVVHKNKQQYRQK